jgi:hypothetical protein
VALAPSASVGAVGVTLSVVATRLATLIGIVAVLPPATAVMLTLPATMPVTLPVEVTVAMAGFWLCQAIVEPVIVAPDASLATAPACST